MGVWLAEHARWASTARARGLLYALEGYPGFIPDQAGEWISGDLFVIPPGEAGQELLAALDDYEECSPRFPYPHEYRRIMLEVDTDDGTLAAWTYIYNWPVIERAKIRGGDFLREQPPAIAPRLR